MGYITRVQLCNLRENRTTLDLRPANTRPSFLLVLHLCSTTAIVYAYWASNTYGLLRHGRTNFFTNRGITTALPPYRLSPSPTFFQSSFSSFFVSAELWIAPITPCFFCLQTLLSSPHLSAALSFRRVRLFFFKSSFLHLLFSPFLPSSPVFYLSKTTFASTICIICSTLRTFALPISTPLYRQTLC